MKHLPATLKSGGFQYDRVYVTPGAYVYQQRKHNRVTSYEVIKRKVTKASTCVRDGVTIHTLEREAWPKAKHFGVWAWTLMPSELDRAKMMAEAL